MLVHVVHADSVPYVRDGLVRVLHAVRVPQHQHSRITGEWPPADCQREFISPRGPLIGSVAEPVDERASDVFSP